jgi:hypothetical protein
MAIDDRDENETSRFLFLISDRLKGNLATPRKTNIFNSGVLGGLFSGAFSRSAARTFHRLQIYNKGAFRG